VGLDVGVLVVGLDVGFLDVGLAVVGFTNFRAIFALAKWGC